MGGDFRVGRVICANRFLESKCSLVIVPAVLVYSGRWEFVDLIHRPCFHVCFKHEISSVGLGETERKDEFGSEQAFVFYVCYLGLIAVNTQGRKARILKVCQT